MRHTSLREAIAARCREGEPIICSKEGEWSAQALLSARRELPQAFEAGVGSVVLRFRSPIKLILSLVVLDGRADRILLLSPSVSQKDSDELLDHFKPQLILTDADERGFGPPMLQRPDESTQPKDDGGLGPPPSAVETHWIFATSGTTGRPKLVAHSFRSLTRSVKPDRRIEGGARWGQLFEMARFAGIQVMLQAIAGGATLILPDMREALHSQLRFLAERGCNALSATPTLWRKILLTADRSELNLRQVTLGGEIADDAVLAALKTAFPDARITHVYASTEAGAAFAVHDGRAGFPASYLEAPPGGVSLKTRDGRLFVQNCDVTANYLGTGQSFRDDEGYVDTGDAVERRGDRILFKGRTNGAINIGGNKLFPEQVEHVLLRHPAVRQARIYAKSSPITGQLVLAEIVPKGGIRETDRKALTEELLRFCRTCLPRWQVPAIVRMVDEIRANDAGKIERRAG